MSSSTSSPPVAAPVAAPPDPKRRRELPALELLAAVLVAAVLLRPRVAGLVDQPALQTWSTFFVSIVVQALPFLTLGVVLSGGIAALLPPGWLARALPQRPSLAVPIAGLAGVALPGCECGSVPIAGRLTASGVTPAAALAFMLSAPAINPVVLVATSVAFPGQPRVVLARFVASLFTAVVVGLIWTRLGREEWIARARNRVMQGTTRWESFTSTARHDFLHAGGWLVLGAMAAATLQVVVPRSILTRWRAARPSPWCHSPSWRWSWRSARKRTRSSRRVSPSSRSRPGWSSWWSAPRSTLLEPLCGSASRGQALTQRNRHAP